MRNIYHIYTNGTAKGLWFLNEEDFRLGMNSIPSCAMGADITIYCFCLMSNHVHFIVQGEKEGCIKFIKEYKKQRSRQIAEKYDGEHILSGADTGIKLVDSADYFKTLIAYVLRNPLAARMNILPSEYRWSSGNLYFSERAFCLEGLRKLGELSHTQQRNLFKTRILLPENYLIDSSGIIFPGSYVNFKAVEKAFVSAKNLLYYLSKTNDMEVELESGILAKVRYTDIELLASLECLCSEKFSGKKYSTLRIEDKYRLSKLLYKCYGASPKQIARVAALDYYTLKTML